MDGLGRYVQKILDWDILEKHGKRLNKLCGIEVPDLFSLPYKTLKKDIPKLLVSQDLNKVLYIVLNHVKKCNFVRIVLTKKKKRIYFLLWILEQYDKINQMEKVQLKTTINPKWINAGIRKLEVLEDFNLIDTITKDYNYTHKDAELLPYAVIYSIQLKNKIIGDVQAKMRKNDKI